jgi:hypothetical protein
MALCLSSQATPAFAGPTIYFYGYNISRSVVDGRYSVRTSFEVRGINLSSRVEVKVTIGKVNTAQMQTFYFTYNGPGRYNPTIQPNLETRFGLQRGHSYMLFVWIRVPNIGGWAPYYVQNAQYYLSP